MNARIFFIIIIFVGAIISAQAVGENFSISVASIPDDGNGYDVRAQCWNDGNGQFRIIVDVDSVNDPQIDKIVAHEIGHVNNWDADEAYADDFANRVVPEGEPIVDAYHGVH